MNKNDLIDAIAADADLSKASAGRALDAAIGAITGALAKGGSVSLVGFGTFSVKARAARQGRNPRTGETIQIAASNTPGFKAGKALKDAVNKKLNLLCRLGAAARKAPLCAFFSSSTSGFNPP